MPFSNIKPHLGAEMRIQSEIEPQMCLSVSRVSGKDVRTLSFLCQGISVTLSAAALL